jgi:hypothetical protein
MAERREWRRRPQSRVCAEDQPHPPTNPDVLVATRQSSFVRYTDRQRRWLYPARSSARRPAIADTPPSHFRHSAEEPDRWHKRLPRWRLRGDAGTREERREDRNGQDVASWRFDLIPLRVACAGGVWRIAIPGDSKSSWLCAAVTLGLAQRKGRFGLVKSPQP